MALLLRVVSVALLASLTTANLTPYTATYDATIVYVKTSLSEISAVVAAQKNPWLSEQFTELGEDIDTAIVNGQLSYTGYMDLLRAFFSTAETKVPKFTETSNARLENSAIDFAQYNAAAPRSWCDYVFATFADLADAANRRSLRELVAATRSDIEHEIEANATASAINERMKVFYQQANTFDSSVIAAFDAKVAAFVDATVANTSSSKSESTSSVQGPGMPTSSQATSVCSHGTIVAMTLTLLVMTPFLHVGM